MAEVYRRPFITSYRILGIIICVLALVLSTQSPGQTADKSAKILKIVHGKLANGDSFTLTADQPFPKESINSTTTSLEIEFKGVDCALPPGSEGVFATSVNGELVNRLDVDVDGIPPSSKIKFSLQQASAYTYVLVRHSPTKIEVQLAYAADPEPLIYVASTASISAKPPPGIETMEEPPEIKSDLPDVSLIQKIVFVKHFKLDDDSDRIEFTFDGYAPMPVTKLRKFPRRIELRFPITYVKFPSPNQGRDFATAVPGHLAEEMRVWNPEETGGESVFRFKIRGEAEFSWVVHRISGNKLSLEIRPVKVTPQLRAEWKDVLGIKPGGLSAFRTVSAGKSAPSVSEESAAPPEVVTLPALDLELNWPGDADVIAEQISLLTSKLGPGYIIDLPLRLRLYTDPNSYRKHQTTPKP